MRTEAVVVLQGEGGVKGVISFVQSRPRAQVRLNGTITGLTPGAHGFHVHQKGDLREGCKSTAGHFNPYMVKKCAIV
jgi:Cu-Zn family superoxide dismutase